MTELTLLVTALVTQTVSVVVAGDSSEAAGIGAGIVSWLLLVTIIIWRIWA